MFGNHTRESIREIHKMIREARWDRSMAEIMASNRAIKLEGRVDRLERAVYGKCGTCGAERKGPKA